MLPKYANKILEQEEAEVVDGEINRHSQEQQLVAGRNKQINHQQQCHNQE